MVKKTCPIVFLCLFIVFFLSFVKFQSHLDRKIDDFAPIWVFPYDKSNSNTRMAMTWHTHCFKGLGRVPHIIFWGHHTGQTSSLGQWQLSNPPDLPCLPCTHLVINTGILLVNIRQAWGYTRSSCPHKWNPDTKKTSFCSRSILTVRIISYYRGWPVRVSYTLVKNIGNVCLQYRKMLSKFNVSICNFVCWKKGVSTWVVKILWYSETCL